MRPASRFALRSLRDIQVRIAGFSLLFAVVAVVNVVGYRRAYPTRLDRIVFARSFGANNAVRLFYGVPHDLLTVGGYAAWRVGGVLAIMAAIWGYFAAGRLLRGEEDAGRQELVLATAVSRRGAYLAVLAALGIGVVCLFTATFVGLVASSLAAGQSALLALSIVSPAVVFIGVGALASQLAPRRRVATELATAVFMAAFAVRVIADTTTNLGGLRWATPLGWAEEMRPFANPMPGVVIVPIIASAALLVASGLIATRRDIARGLLRSRDAAEPRLRLLSSPLAQALRSESGALLGWLIGTAVFAVIIGLLSKSFTNLNLSASLRQQLAKLGGATLTTPAGALGFYFLFFVLAISVFAASQTAAARREEADQRLETMLALPVSRSRWFGGRLTLTAAAATALALAAGVGAWLGATLESADVPLLRMLEAAVNTLPTAWLFGALGALALAALPRAAAGITYGLVLVAFLWDLFGALLSAPAWTVALSPFDHIGFVPAQPFHAAAAGVMLLAAGGASLAAVAVFRRRDLTSG